MIHFIKFYFRASCSAVRMLASRNVWRFNARILKMMAYFTKKGLFVVKVFFFWGGGGGLKGSCKCKEFTNRFFCY